ncbi:CHAP domain-containing protein [Nocardioides sp. URHA0020]|uniref:CHAP domain-containing protein n=1 Tax=Nocardioides sp. URHA0020 TaxID=1380392 RepID=UPI0012DBE13F|nr:CHAP domain-containing protein [Nocardioides sp. URHA0020]
MSLRNRLRAPLVSAVAAALIGGLLVSSPAVAQAPTKPDDRTLARERQAAGDSLTRSQAVFARSSYLCMGYTACRKAGMGSGGYASVNDKMYWRMYSGHNCTNYAAYRMVHSGLPNTRPWSGGGNATYWGTSVPEITDGVPAIGAVAWWRANTGPAGSAGHVAYVEKVVSSDEIVISQDSWGGDFSWAVVTKASGNWPSGFIHFNDVELVNKARPEISGLAKVGAKLSASAGTWTPTDAKIGYQWYVHGVLVPKVTASSLTVTSSMLGESIRVKTTATKAGYPTKSSISAATKAVLPGVIASRAAPAVTGVPQVDQTLTLRPGTWNVTPSATAVQWYAGGAAIPGATGLSLVLAPELATKVISARVTARRTGYSAVTVRTTSTEPIALGDIGVDLEPRVTGTRRPGARLTLNPGAYRPGDAAVAIQWLRDGRWISGARATTYKLRSADLGLPVTARVTVTRAGYEPTTLTYRTAARVKVTPQIRLQQVRLKHGGVRLRVTLVSRWVPRPDGKIVVRVQGGFRKALVLRNGAAQVNVTGVRAGRRPFKITYWGGPTTERVVRTGNLRIR